MKKYFITGLVTLLPLALTLAIAIFIVNFLTQPFVGFFEKFFESFSWYPHYRGLIHFLLQIILLFSLIVFTTLLGFLARAMVFKSMLKLQDYFLHRIPVIKSVYKATQQLIKTLLGGSSRSFKQVVMVPYPSEKSYCIGFVSGNGPMMCENAMQRPLLTVFVPTTPNPTSGFLMLFAHEDVIYIDMKVEDAFKYIISCGVISSEEMRS